MAKVIPIREKPVDLLHPVYVQRLGDPAIRPLQLHSFAICHLSVPSFLVTSLSDPQCKWLGPLCHCRWFSYRFANQRSDAGVQIGW